MKNAKFRWWFITWNNPPTDWKAALQSLQSNYGIGQLEKGEEGTPHIQAILWFKDSQRGSFWTGKSVWAKGLLSEDAVERVENYCTKSQSRLDGPLEFGIKPIRRNSSLDWESARTLAKEGKFEKLPAQIHISHFNNLKKIHAEAQEPLLSASVRGLWIHGAPGVGKSHYAYHTYPGAYRKPQNKWFDGYLGEPFIILDDFDLLGACLGHYLKIWADRWPCTGEIKGAHVALKHEKFIITSNYTPDQIWTDSILVEAITRRFELKFIGQNSSYENELNIFIFDKKI